MPAPAICHLNIVVSQPTKRLLHSNFDRPILAFAILQDRLAILDRHRLDQMKYLSTSRSTTALCLQETVELKSRVDRTVTTGTTAQTWQAGEGTFNNQSGDVPSPAGPVWIG